MKKYFVTGINGSGKSTLAKELTEIGYDVIDLDHVKDLCIWINKKTGERSYWSQGVGKEFFEENEYIVNEKMLVELMSSKKDPVVVVGLADKQVNLFHLFDKIFLLHCDEDVFVQRLTERTNNNFGNDPKEREMILGYYKSFEKEMLDHGAILLNTNNSIKIVCDEFINNIRL